MSACFLALIINVEQFMQVSVPTTYVVGLVAVENTVADSTLKIAQHGDIL